MENKFIGVICPNQKVLDRVKEKTKTRLNYPSFDENQLPVIYLNYKGNEISGGWDRLSDAKKNNTEFIPWEIYLEERTGEEYELTY